MSQSPGWSALPPEPRNSAAAFSHAAADRAVAPTKPAHGRLSPLQTAAATAVIVTSLAGLAAITGVFSSSVGSEPVLPDAVSNSPLRSAGGPVPQPTVDANDAPPGMVTENGASTPGLRASPSLATPSFSESTADTSAGGRPAALAGSAMSANPPGARFVPVIPAPQVAAAAPPAPVQRTVRRSLPHQEHPHRTHQGKTREQVIEELMQAKRDGSYRALQENYR